MNVSYSPHVNGFAVMGIVHALMFYWHVVLVVGQLSVDILAEVSIMSAMIRLAVPCEKILSRQIRDKVLSALLQKG